MSYRVLVVDDEPLARQRLKRLLDEHKDFACIAEAGTASEMGPVGASLKLARTIIPCPFFSRRNANCCSEYADPSTFRFGACRL